MMDAVRCWPPVNSVPFLRGELLRRLRHSKQLMLTTDNRSGSLVSRPELLYCRCSSSSSSDSSELRTCKNCKKLYDPALNHPRACRYHTAHFGGETKRKFESVYTGEP